MSNNYQNRRNWKHAHVFIIFISIASNVIMSLVDFLIKHYWLNHDMPVRPIYNQLMFLTAEKVYFWKACIIYLIIDTINITSFPFRHYARINVINFHRIIPINYKKIVVKLIVEESWKNETAREVVFFIIICYV